VHEAWAHGRASANPDADTKANPDKLPWKGIADRSKSVTFLQGTLQGFDPAAPRLGTKYIGRVGYEPDNLDTDMDSGFDVIWCQWCLGHMRDVDLVTFFVRCKGARRDASSVIVVKENVCKDAKDGGPVCEFDEQDSSVTRWVLFYFSPWQMEQY
jgi:protein N-terminal methyltransferase